MVWGALGGFRFTDKQNARRYTLAVDDVSCFSRGFSVGMYRLKESLAVVLAWPISQCILWSSQLRAGKMPYPSASGLSRLIPTYLHSRIVRTHLQPPIFQYPISNIQSPISNIQSPISNLHMIPHVVYLKYRYTCATASDLPEVSRPARQLENPDAGTL